MLIKNVRIVPVSVEPIENGWIQFGEKIEAMGRMESCPVYLSPAALYSSSQRECDTQSHTLHEILDASGLTACPGFVDAHTHLGLFGDAQDAMGEDGNEDTSPSTPQMRAIDGLNPFDPCWQEALSAGVTTVCVAPGSANPIGGMTCILKTYGHGLPVWRMLRESAALKLALGENPKRTYGTRQALPITRMGIAALIREKFTAAKEYLKKHAVLDDDKPDFDPELDALARVLEQKLPLHIHAHRADDILTGVRLAEEFRLPYVIVHGTQGHIVADLLAEKNSSVFCGPLFGDRCKPELAGATPRNPGLLRAAGVKTAITTDHPETPVQYLAPTAGLAVREGMKWTDALRSITLTPAELLGIANRVGSLEVGKDADITLFSEDPLTLAAKPVQVFANGTAQL
ncbi:MAG: amidohydrolase family protein [Oscillospiraceae bacterium]|jgi:imidazolonepropionase-like amidohydrolase|nr:amidohydrolase family protein [Oscillospiraceae bacterium]